MSDYVNLKEAVRIYIAMKPTGETAKSRELIRALIVEVTGLRSYLPDDVKFEIQQAEK